MAHPIEQAQKRLKTLMGQYNRKATALAKLRRTASRSRSPSTANRIRKQQADLVDLEQRIRELSSALERALARYRAEHNAATTTTRQRKRKLDPVQTARQLVWQGSWKRTPGGLTKSDLKMTADGRIVSKRASAAAKRRFNANPQIRRAFAQARK